jgi:CDP-diacylglycerol--serine O-phosphatidyltransferase
MTRHLPNVLTCCNLLCGCIGVVFVLEDRAWPAAYFVWMAGVFDFFDGFVARLLKVSSPIGKELDSLADMVSFGLLPAVVMYKMFLAAGVTGYLPYAAFSIAVFSAVRLAIFNIDETQSDSFRGVPTPANALFITALPLLSTTVLAVVQIHWVLVCIVALSSYLLVSNLRLFALKFKDYRWQNNKVRFTFLLFSVLLVATLQVAAIPVIILLYITLSLGIQLVSK